MKAGLRFISSKRLSTIRSWYIFILAIIGSWAVCMGDTTLPRPFFVPILPLCCYIINISFVLFLRKKIKTDDLLMIIVPLIGFGLYNLNVYNRESYSPNALYFFNLLIFALTEDSEKERAFVLLRKLFIAASFLGIIAYVSYIGGGRIPYKIEPYYSDASNAYYIDYGFSYIIERLGIIRLCGYVNEPGLFGTLISLILISDRYDLHKIGNIVMFVAALLTVSSAFFIISLLYLFLRYYKNPLTIFSLLLIICLVFYYLFYMGVDNDIINSMIVSRIENGALDARTDEGSEIFNRMKERGLLLWGMGNGYFESHISSGLSYKNILFNFGWIGMLILYLPVLFAAIQKAKKNRLAILLIICFFVSIYQRPYIFNPVYFLVLFGGIQNILISAHTTNKTISIK